VPLYACKRCGFTSAAFRVDAAQAHYLEYPECEGAIEMIFRSDGRDRVRRDGPSRAMSHPEPVRFETEHESRTRLEGPLKMRERRDPHGTIRLILEGELDLTVAAALTDRLAELKATSRPVRLDLSKLAFIDSAGVQALLTAITDARRSGWPFAVERRVSRAVERVADVVGIAQLLWPDDALPERAALADVASES
jgi:anti-anti-sigma factor